ncbi:hypothetical protein OUY22_16915 [Nonomuraea sp. MCN248]|uniref:Uncharacterized protein n=1 Tax=Nonomuraea corallina TaxID=2989783 RepID=A0ABT4SDI3_9ACTN|nr:hypothetical protein [Nonomuraea corallina]MDA0635103.1 hypothetical protein [Nonomuraea corallina]
MISRDDLELALPGATIGAVAGALAGGLTLIAGAPAGLAAQSALALSVPLAFFGGLYGLLLGRGVFRPGTFAPTGLYWMVAFPLSRLLQESVAGNGADDGVLTFLLFQAMVSLGFAIGFVFLHERVMPPWLMRRRADNLRAQALFGLYVRHAQVLQTRKGTRR